MKRQLVFALLMNPSSMGTTILTTWFSQAVDGGKYNSKIHLPSKFVRSANMIKKEYFSSKMQYGYKE
jgi:hypothetical protein